MIDKLVQFLIDIVELFFFIRVIDCFDEGVLLRFGKFSKVLKPGWHLVFPFSIDEVLRETVVVSTMSLGMQSLTSKDGKAITVQAVIQYKINDIKKLLLNVDDHEAAVADRCSGAIRPILAGLNLEDLLELDATTTNDLLRPECRKVTTRWGVDITNVSLPDLTTVRTIRLLQE